MSDGNTAEETGTIGECLYSNGNRIEIAKILFNMGKHDLLATILEDLLYHIQNMVDEYCVVKE
uniref:Uncharacterized protein n=1 Tax=viral metagenome TaxID=1070528 RepID=A0A6M3J3T7_9ZZZZ